MHKVLSTTNYSRFKLMDGNRPVGKRVNNLIREVKRKNMLAQFPILVQKNCDGRMYIADGQHRFEAAKALKLPIFYVESKNVTIEDVAHANSQQKAWNLGDYLASWIGQGKKDYAVLRDYMESYGIPITTAIQILGGHQGSSELARFRSGIFHAKNVSHGHRVGAALTRIKEFVPFYRERGFAMAISRLIATGKFDVEQFAKKLTYQATKLAKCASWQDYLPLIEEIYNYKVRAGEMVALAIEVKKMANPKKA